MTGSRQPPEKGSPCPSLVLSGAYAAGRIPKAKSALAVPTHLEKQHPETRPRCGEPRVKGAGPFYGERPGATPHKVREDSLFHMSERDRRPASSFF